MSVNCNTMDYMLLIMVVDVQILLHDTAANGKRITECPYLQVEPIHYLIA